MARLLTRKCLGEENWFDRSLLSRNLLVFFSFSYRNCSRSWRETERVWKWINCVFLFKNFVTDLIMTSDFQAGSRKEYPCDRCDRSYKNKSSLQRHRKYECGSEKKFVCPICHKRMLQKCSLRMHMHTAHGI